MANSLSIQRYICALISVALLALPGCSMFFRWHTSYQGVIQEPREFSLSFGDVAMKCSFGLRNGWFDPVAFVELKNLSTDPIMYDFSGAVLAAGDVVVPRESAPDEKGWLEPGKKVRLRVAFEKMVGVHRTERIGDTDSMRWSATPVTLRLGTFVVADSVIAIPGLEFSDRRERGYL